MFTSKSFELSFEVFPPNTLNGMNNLRKFSEMFYQTYNPDYFSVTFGAGGCNQEKTLRTVEQFHRDRIPVAPHLACVGLFKSTIDSLLHHYQSLGINRLVIIRGDQPEKPSHAGDFTNANQLVSYTRKITGDFFRIAVAAYPEFHPETRQVSLALQHFYSKVQAGANYAITQYFYNSDAYFSFLNSCKKLHIDIPIIPGIMPIHDFTKLKNFSALCGAEIPLWLYKRLDSFGTDTESVHQYGVEIVSRLCEELLRAGAPGLHFYTLNQAEPTESILSNLRLKVSKMSSSPIEKIVS